MFAGIGRRLIATARPAYPAVTASPALKTRPTLLIARAAFLGTRVEMPSPKITLYVDTVSPFAYEAYWLLRVSFLLL
jgi:hypothetical protein